MRDYASLYSYLLEDLGFPCTPDAHIFSDMDVRDAARTSLAISFYKKLCPNGNSAAADAAALIKFKAINASLPTDTFEFKPENEVESLFYDYFKDNLRVTLEPHVFGLGFDLEFIRQHMAVGPGASQKADSTSMISKLFLSEISYIHEDLIPLYRSALAETGVWAEAEMLRFQTYGFVKVRGGKLFFASKNAEISRTCCTEASLEMLIQKACGAFLELRLEENFGISLKTQPDNNRELARIGSIDGSFGTVDLVSASDSIGLQLFLDALPNCPLKTMMLRCRSEFAVLPDGEEVELRMISTMGNGFTFPLQTVIFASAVRSVYTLMGFPSKCPKTQFGVFGDDIVVRKECYEFLCKMLVKLGFQVNVGKSFNSGAFRESCGHDYVSGRNIRGVYIKSLETPQEVYSAINRLTRWSAVHGVRLHRTLKALMSWVRFVPIPPSEADDAGVCVPHKLSNSTKVDNRYWFKYRYYRARRQVVEVPDGDDEGVINSFAVAVGYLAGVVRRREPSLTQNRVDLIESNIAAERPAFEGLVDVGVISLRRRHGARTRYEIANAYLPYWDYWPDTKVSCQISERPTLQGANFGEETERVSLARGSQVAWESVMVELLPIGEQLGAV